MRVALVLFKQEEQEQNEIRNKFIAINKKEKQICMSHDFYPLQYNNVLYDHIQCTAYNAFKKLFCFIFLKYC